MTTLCTPRDVEQILARARPEYKTMHAMNAQHSLVSGCEIGAVFMFDGEYHVYTGVNGRNRKFPCMATRVRDRAARKFTAGVFERVRLASK